MPVIRSRKYNLLKLKEIYNMRRKDERQGRLLTEPSDGSAYLKADKIQQQKHSLYEKSRRHKYEKVRNHSYLNLMEKVKENYRYCSLER